MGMLEEATYTYSLLHMVTHLRHLRDLYIYFFSVGFKRNLQSASSPTSPLELDRLRIYSIEPGIEEEVIAEFLPYIGGCEDLHYEQNRYGRMMWTRRTDNGQKADAASTYITSREENYERNRIDFARWAHSWG
jgi:hypothetical protein